MKMKTRLWKAICVSIVVGVFVLYGGTYGVAQEKIKAPQMAFSTGSVAGSWFPIGSVISDELNKKYFKSYALTAVPGAGGVGNPKRVSIGDSNIRFGISFACFLIAADQGKAPYDKAYPNLRAICSLVTNAFYLIGDEKLGIKTIGEIKDRKLPLKLGADTPGSTGLFTTKLIFSEMGSSLDDIKKWGGKVNFSGTSARVNLWKDRHIDAWIGFINHPASAISQAQASRPGKIIGLEKPLREKLKKKWGYVDYVIPAGTYKGQDQKIVTTGLSMILFAEEGVSDPIVYRFTKTVAEMKDKLVKTNGAFKTWEPKDMVKGLGIKVHPGARQYYKERGWM
jgi:TRAP transporter TAXI family solute receptor